MYNCDAKMHKVCTLSSTPAPYLHVRQRENPPLGDGTRRCHAKVAVSIWRLVFGSSSRSPFLWSLDVQELNRTADTCLSQSVLLTPFGSGMALTHTGPIALGAGRTPLLREMNADTSIKSPARHIDAVKSAPSVGSRESGGAFFRLCTRDK